MFFANIMALAILIIQLAVFMGSTILTLIFQGLSALPAPVIQTAVAVIFQALFLTLSQETAKVLLRAWIVLATVAFMIPALYRYGGPSGVVNEQHEFAYWFTYVFGVWPIANTLLKRMVMGLLALVAGYGTDTSGNDVLAPQYIVDLPIVPGALIHYLSNIFGTNMRDLNVGTNDAGTLVISRTCVILETLLTALGTTIANGNKIYLAFRATLATLIGRVQNADRATNEAVTALQNHSSVARRMMAQLLKVRKSLNTKIAQRTEDNKALKAKIETLDEIVATHGDLSATLRAVQMELANESFVHKVDIDSFRTTDDKRNNIIFIQATQINDIQIDLDSLKVEHDDARTQLKYHERSLELYHEKYKSLEDEFDNLQEMADQANEKVKSLKAEHDEDIARAEEENRELREENYRLNLQLAEVKAMVEEMANCNKRLIDDYVKQLYHAEKHCTRKRRQLQAYIDYLEEELGKVSPANSVQPVQNVYNIAPSTGTLVNNSVQPIETVYDVAPAINTLVNSSPVSSFSAEALPTETHPQFNPGDAIDNEEDLPSTTVPNADGSPVINLENLLAPFGDLGDDEQAIKAANDAFNAQKDAERATEVSQNTALNSQILPTSTSDSDDSELIIITERKPAYGAHQTSDKYAKDIVVPPRAKTGLQILDPKTGLPISLSAPAQHSRPAPHENSEAEHASTTEGAETIEGQTSVVFLGYKRRKSDVQEQRREKREKEY